MKARLTPSRSRVAITTGGFAPDAASARSGRARGRTPGPASDAGDTGLQCTPPPVVNQSRSRESIGPIRSRRVILARTASTVPLRRLLWRGEPCLEDEAGERLAQSAGYGAETGLRPSLGRLEKVCQVGGGEREVSVGLEEAEDRDVLCVDPGVHGHACPRAGMDRMGDVVSSPGSISVPPDPRISGVQPDGCGIHGRSRVGDATKGCVRAYASGRMESTLGRIVRLRPGYPDARTINPLAITPAGNIRSVESGAAAGVARSGQDARHSPTGGRLPIKIPKRNRF